VVSVQLFSRTSLGGPPARPVSLTFDVTPAVLDLLTPAGPQGPALRRP